MLFTNNIMLLSNKINIRIIREFRISIREFIIYQYVRNFLGQESVGEDNIIILN
jgi:hypothetical protein